MPFSRTLERLLFIAGMALLLLFAGALAYREVASRLAISAYRSANRGAPSAAETAGFGIQRNEPVDYTLWSTKRVAAYKEALARMIDTPLAVLRCPKLGVEAPVFDGTSELVLNRGIGRIAGTSRPGEPGNVGIAGHRDGFFRALKDIAVGDRVTLETGGGVATYVVDAIRIVDPTDVSVLEPTPVPTITLVTCYPFYFIGDAPQRFIIRCSLKDQARRKASNESEHAGNPEEQR